MKLGLGTVQLGMEYGVANKTGKPDISAAMEILKTAAGGGIDCFDTASAYGDSESVIGLFLKEEPGKEISRPKLCSKFTDCANAEAELDGTLTRLGVDRLDYFLLHKSAQVFDAGFGRMISALGRNPAAGKVGVSVYAPCEVEECLKYDVQVLQIPFNIVDTRFAGDGLARRIKARGIELHARSIYLQGLLLTDSERLRGAGTVLDGWAAKLGITRKELIFAYARDCGFIDRFFVGCETAAQVRENLEMYALPPLPEWVARRAENAFSDMPEEVVNPSLWERM